MKYWLFAVILLWSGIAEATTRYAGPSGTLVTGNCTSSTNDATACTVARLLSVLVAGDTGILLNGTYRGANFMLNSSFMTSNGSSGNPITVQAQTEGSVFIDGQTARVPISLTNISYWSFIGIDAGTSSSDTAVLIDTSHVTFQRSCFSNARTASNTGVLSINNSSDTLIEDVCVFGTGRNMIIVYQDDGFGLGRTSVNNVFRRVWTRFEGWQTDGSNINAYNIQTEYYQHGDETGNSPKDGNDLYENVIAVYGGGIQTHGSGLEVYPGLSRRWASLQVRRLGWILYGYTTAAQTCCPAVYREQGATPSSGTYQGNIADIFSDARWNTSTLVPAVHLDCTSGTHCSTNSANRITALRNSASPSSTFGWSNTTNTNECTSLASCPDFYTGTLGGASGARNCFEYSNGTLTSTALWPWRMDDRIKSALARANASGLGGTALSGSAGTGYAANTVTSEIVSRYGAIPGSCLRGTPAAPSGLIIHGLLLVGLVGLAIQAHRLMAGMYAG